MLMIGDRLNSYSIGAGEPWIMSVQMRANVGNAIIDWSNRRLVLSFYDGSGQAVDQIEGDYTADGSGAYFAFIRDGRFSEALGAKSGIVVELSERLLNGRAIIATGPLTVVRSSPNVAPFGSTIGRAECRFTIYFDATSLVRTIEQEILPYVGVIAPAPTLSALSLSGALVSGVGSSGTIIGATAGSVITENIAGLTINSTNRSYSWDGTGVAGTIENALVETLIVATNSPRSSPLTIAAAGPALNSLTLSTASIQVGSPAAININGATSGSTITGTPPDGMTLNSIARTITGTPTQAGTFSILLTETLAGATGSPRQTAVTLTVTTGVIPDIFNTLGSSTLKPAQINGATAPLTEIDTRLSALGV